MNVTANVTAKLDHTVKGIGSVISQLLNESSFGMSNASNDNGNDTEQARNGTSSAMLDSSTITKIVNPLVAIVIATVTLAIHIPLLVVLKKSKITVSLKLLLSNMVTCTIMYFLFISVANVAIIMLNDMYFLVIYNVRGIVAMAIYSTSSCTTVGLAIQRLIVMLKPCDHVNIITKRNSIIYIASSWCYGFLIPIIICLYDLFTDCEMEVRMCEFSNALNINRGIFACTYTCILFITVGTYIKIRKVVKKQMNIFQTSPAEPQTKVIQDSAQTDANTTSTTFTNISDVPEQSCSQTNNGYTPLPQRKTFRVATQVILKIIITHTASYVLVIITSVIFLLFPEWISASTRSAMQIMNFTSSIFGTYISLYFYTWNMKECRKRLFLHCCSCSRKLKERANQMVI